MALIALRPGPFLTAGLIYSLALALRLGFLVQSADSPLMLIPVVDERINWEVAELVQDDQLPDVPYCRAPGYLYLTVLLGDLVGRDPFTVRIAQAFIDAFAPVLLFLIARACFGMVPGIVAGLLGAVFWTLVFYSVQLLDAWLTTLMALAVTAAVVCLPRRRLATWLLVGALVGIGAVVRPTLLALAPALVAAQLMLAAVNAIRNSADPTQPASIPRRAWLAVLPSLALAVGCAVVIAPVTLRNRIASGEWVLISFSGGANLWMANNPKADGKEPTFLLSPDLPLLRSSRAGNPWEWDLAYHIGTNHAWREIGHDAGFDAVDRYYAALALDYIGTHPGKFLADVGKRLAWTFNAYEFPNNKDVNEFTEVSTLLRVLSYLHVGIVAPFGLLGLSYLLYRHRQADAAAYYYVVILLAVATTGLLFVIMSRYRLPLVGLLLPFAAYGITSFVALLRSFRTSVAPTLVSLALLAAFAALSNLNVFAYRPRQRAPYLDFVLATTAQEIGHRDALDDAMRSLGAGLTTATDEPLREGSLTQLVVRHYRPFRMLVHYHARTGQWKDALQYARRMVRLEPVDAATAASFFNRLSASDDPDIVLAALRLVTTLLLEQDPRALIRCSAVAMQRGIHPAAAYDYLDLLRGRLGDDYDDDLARLNAAAEMAAKKHFNQAMRTAIHDGKPQAVFDALRRLGPVLMKHDPALFADFLIQVGSGTKDRKLVQQALSILNDQAALAADPQAHRDRIDRAQRILDSLSQGADD